MSSYSDEIRRQIKWARSRLKQWAPKNKRERQIKIDVAASFTSVVRFCREADCTPFDPERMDPLSWSALLARAGQAWCDLTEEQRDPIRLLAEIERLRADRDGWRRAAEATVDGTPLEEVEHGISD